MPTVVASFRETCRGQPAFDEEKEKQLSKMLRADLRRLLRIAGAVPGVRHTIVWHFLRRILSMFFNRVQTGHLISETDRKNCVFSGQLCKRGLEENFNFLERIFFSDEQSFSLQGADIERNCRICGFRRHEPFYELLQSFLTLVIRYAVFETEIVRSPFFDDGTVTGER